MKVYKPENMNESNTVCRLDSLELHFYGHLIKLDKIIPPSKR